MDASPPLDIYGLPARRILQFHLVEKRLREPERVWDFTPVRKLQNCVHEAGYWKRECYADRETRVIHALVQGVFRKK